MHDLEETVSEENKNLDKKVKTNYLNAQIEALKGFPSLNKFNF